METRLTVALDEVVRALDRGESVSAGWLRENFADCWEAIVEALELQRTMRGQVPEVDSIGPYRVLRKLGSGGMGAVYLAQHRDAAGPAVVAIKVIRPDLQASSHALSRFLGEAELGARVDHPNVVRVLDSGIAECDQRHLSYLVMEYVEGQTLHELAAEVGPVGEELCRHIGRDVAAGLAAIHAEGAVHRDVKPSNVIIADDQTVKVMDLGASGFVEPAGRPSRPGRFVGSFLYAAPEQLVDAQGELCPTWDLFALGVLLEELITGRHPLEPRRGGRCPTVSAFLECLIRSLVAPDPRDRPASAQAVVTILDEGESGEWWRARAPSFVPTLGRGPPALSVSRDASVRGRDVELACLQAALADAVGGHPRVVLVEGEAGVGKTRLVDEFLHLAWSDDAAFDFVEVGHEYPGARSAEPWFEGFRELVGADADSAAVEGRLAVLPETASAVLRALRPDTAGGDRPESADAVEGVVRALARSLGTGRPAVVFVDDLHLASDRGRAALLSVVSELGDRSVLVVAATRACPPASWLETVRAVAHVDRLELRRLSQQDLRELLCDVFGSERIHGELFAQIADRSGGNPHFALEIVRSLREHGAVVCGADGATPTAAVPSPVDLPASVRELIDSRLGLLRDAERRVVSVAACVGSCFDGALVADALEEPRVSVLRSLSRLESAHRLLRAEGRAFEFDHAVVRECVYGSLPEGLRDAHHAALASTLIRRGRDGDAPEICRHLVHAGRPEEALGRLPAAVAWLEQRGARNQVAELVSSVLGVDGLLVGEARTVWLLRLADAHSWMADLEAERAVLRTARAELEQLSDVATLARLAVREARNLHRAGETRAARAAARAALRECRRLDDSVGVAECAGVLAAGALRRGRIPLGEARARQQLAAAREAASAENEVDALKALGTAMQSRSDYAAAMECARDALDIARARGLRSRAAQLTGNVGSALACQRRFGEAQDWIRRGARAARELGDRSAEIRMTGNLITLATWTGDYGALLDLAERLVALARSTGDLPQVAESLSRYAGVLQRLGYRDRATEMRTEALSLFRHCQDADGEVTELIAIANAAEVESRIEDAVVAYESALSAAVVAGRQRTYCETLLFSGFVLRQAGRLELADQRVSSALTIARERGWRGLVTYALADLATRHSKYVPEARAAAAANRELLSSTETIDVNYALWLATREREYLVASHAEVLRVIERAPTEAARRGIRDIPLHRDVLADAAAQA